MDKGFVYILTNPSFREDWVKIGMSSRPVDIRSKELDNTAVPLPFDIFATLETAKYVSVEKLVHKTIDRLTDLRIRQNREFFNIRPEKALDILKDIATTLDDGVIKEYHGEVEEPVKEQVKPKVEKPIARVKREKESTSWILPANQKFFDLEGCFKRFGHVHWKQKVGYKVGYSVFVYSSFDDHYIKYELVVDAVNQPSTAEMLEEDAYSSTRDYHTDTKVKYAKMTYVRTIDSTKGNWEALKKYGLKGILMGPRSLNGSLLDFVKTL